MSRDWQKVEVFEPAYQDLKNLLAGAYMFIVSQISIQNTPVEIYRLAESVRTLPMTQSSFVSSSILQPIACANSIFKDF